MVDIVIVNWNSGDYLKKCIDSISINGNNEKNIGRVFIIDNNSSDRSLERVTIQDKLVILKNKENMGFSKACNQGFQLCTSPFVLLLNPDARLLDTTLEDCINFISLHPEVDILGCQLLNDEGIVTPSCARFPVPLRFFFDTVGLSKLAPKVFTPAILMSDWDHQNSRQVDQVMGAFMFLRISVFEKIGYFDERFFVYYEELDFSKRLSEYGGMSYFNANIQAMHSGGGSTNKVKAYRLFLNLRSRLLYGRKHFSSAGYFFLAFCTLIIEPVTRSFFLLMKKESAANLKEVWSGYKLLFTQKKPEKY